jgi:tRNA-Thr(GGU) m(6)t(6)A37 methyltransferase TsaA
MTSNYEKEIIQNCEDFWKALQRCHANLPREQFWLVREELHYTVFPKLMVLLRFQQEGGKAWNAGNPAEGIETILSEEDLARLKRCIPDRDDRDLLRAVHETAEFGAETCSLIYAEHGWNWSQKVDDFTFAPPGLVQNEIEELPPFYIQPIGIVRSSVDELLRPDEIKSKPAQIIINRSLSPGLDGLIGSQRLLVIFQFHKLTGFELHQHPRNDPQRPKRGVFALHSPQRPNPIGVTEVDLIRREGNILYVKGLDAVNGTPILDLKLNK